LVSDLASEDGIYCPAGTLTWACELSGDALRSAAALSRSLAAPQESLTGAPPSPDWVFERR
jgi:hypothetical protein